MEKEGLTEQEAFERLRRASQLAGRPLKVVAEALIATARAARRLRPERSTGRASAVETSCDRRSARTAGRPPHGRTAGACVGRGRRGCRVGSRGDVGRVDRDVRQGPRRPRNEQRISPGTPSGRGSHRGQVGGVPSRSPAVPNGPRARAAPQALRPYVASYRRVRLDIEFSPTRAPCRSARGSPRERARLALPELDDAEALGRLVRDPRAVRRWLARRERSSSMLVFESARFQSIRRTIMRSPGREPARPGRRRRAPRSRLVAGAARAAPSRAGRGGRAPGRERRWSRRDASPPGRRPGAFRSPNLT